jgi:hypothetical protein
MTDSEDDLDKAIRLAKEAADLAWTLSNEFQDDGAFGNSSTCETASRVIAKAAEDLEAMKRGLT